MPGTISFKRLEECLSSILEHPFIKLQVKEVVWDCKGSNTPRPDGFTLEFYKNHWETIKKYLFKNHWETIKDDLFSFHSKEILIKGCTSSFLAIILKVHNP